jgi:hypothetical protein
MAMIKIPPGPGSHCRINADQSNEAQATKGIDTWQYCRGNDFRGYNPFLNMAQPVNGSPASQLMTISRDG